ncbi:MAG: hypothetical protein AB1643_00180 [Patescibacteria group bacterium]
MLQKIEIAYNNGKIAAKIFDKISAQEFAQKTWSKEDLILLASDVESYFGQEEKREHYGLLQKAIYNLAFKFSR